MKKVSDKQRLRAFLSCEEGFRSTKTERVFLSQAPPSGRRILNLRRIGIQEAMVSEILGNM